MLAEGPPVPRAYSLGYHVWSWLIQMDSVDMCGLSQHMVAVGMDARQKKSNLIPLINGGWSERGGGDGQMVSSWSNKRRLLDMVISDVEDLSIEGLGNIEGRLWIG